MLKWDGEHLQSNPDGNLREEESGEDTGDDVDTVVVQHHLPRDRNDSLAGDFHNPPSLDVLSRELQAANRWSSYEEKTAGNNVDTWRRGHCQ